MPALLAVCPAGTIFKKLVSTYCISILYFYEKVNEINKINYIKSIYFVEPNTVLYLLPVVDYRYKLKGLLIKIPLIFR